MPIRKLSPLLVNQIAAGEVIERPASVVRELIDNALDANATRIDIAIEDGGRRLIRISDNGNGIPERELPLAVAAHATSKIERAEDLAAIGTYGFRGEALASIASVARLRVTSKSQGDGVIAESGAVIEAAGADVTPVAPAACSPGTVIEVRDVFFNTPARRKFLRGASAEFGQISEVVQRIAINHPGVAFKLTHNERKVIQLDAGDDRLSRCLSLLGKDLADALLEFEHKDFAASDGASVWGLAGLPEIARATAKFQYICLNGRPIRDRGLSHAIREAYRGLIPPDRHAVVVVMIDLDPTMVDVNVHPAKAEVRFHQPSRMHGLVLHALRQRLLGADLTPAVSFNNTPRFDAPTSSNEVTVHSNAETATDNHEPASPNAFIDYFKRMDPTQKGFVYQQVREELQREQPDVVTSEDEREPIVFDASRSPLTENTASDMRHSTLLQVHKSYIVTQDESGIVIIDQHALHERVMFEQLRQRVLAGPLEGQRLLMPATIDSTPTRITALEDLAPMLERLGIEAESFGQDTIAIHAFPTFLFDRKVEPAAFMSELLDKADDGDIDARSFTEGETAMEEALHEVLDMMACKAAVKAGDQLNIAEINALLQQRDAIERASNCPHGRPTSIRLTLRDLEKQFKRT